MNVLKMLFLFSKSAPMCKSLWACAGENRVSERIKALEYAALVCIWSGRSLVPFSRKLEAHKAWKDMYEAKPTGHQPAPRSRPSFWVTCPFPLVPFASPPEPSRPKTNSSTTALCTPAALLPSPGHCHLSLLLSDPSSSTRQRFCTIAQHGELRASLLSEFVAEEGKGG